MYSRGSEVPDEEHAHTPYSRQGSDERSVVLRCDVFHNLFISSASYDNTAAWTDGLGLADLVPRHVHKCWTYACIDTQVQASHSERDDGSDGDRYGSRRRLPVHQHEPSVTIIPRRIANGVHLSISRIKHSRTLRVDLMRSVY